MTIQKSLSIIFISSLLSLGIFIGFLILIDPKEAGILGTIIFFSSSFLFILGIFTIIFVVFKLRTIKDKERIFEKFPPAFREAIFASLFLSSLAVARLLKFLNWWSVAILFLFFLLLELIFSTRRRRFTYK